LNILSFLGENGVPANELSGERVNMSGFDEGNVHWSDQGLSESQGSNAQVGFAIAAERLCPQMRRNRIAK
jgi:hypothetical protein